MVSPPSAPSSTEEKTSNPTDLSRTLQEIEDPEFSIFILPPFTSANDHRIHLEHVTKADTVLSLRQLIAEYPDVAAYTCYRLEIASANDSISLNEFVELGDYPEIKEEMDIQMVLEKYDARRVRAHIRRLRDIMMNPPIPQNIHSETSKNYMRKAPKTVDPRNGSKGISKKKKNKLNGKIVSQDSNKAKSVSPLPSSLLNDSAKKDGVDDVEGIQNKNQHLSALQDIQIPIQSDLVDFHGISSIKYLLKGDEKSSQEMKDEHVSDVAKLPICIKSIVFSGFNPPPAPRKLSGDLLYLEVLIEGETEELFITAHVDGFFVNNSSRSRFDPAPHATFPCHDHLLLNVLSKASQKFSESYASLLAKAATLAKEGPASIEWMIAAGNNVGGKLPWLTPKSSTDSFHEYDPNRAEDELCASYGIDERGVLRDWNEEYQCCRELPKNTLKEQIIRSRVMYKIVNEFVESATQGAVAIVEGHIPPINPMDEHNAHVYVFNNIFYSLSIDGKLTSKDSLASNGEGGYSSANRDMLGVKAINEADVSGLYTLATAIVDYLGMRVVAQSVIPGILQGEASSKLVYGSVDGGKSIAANPKIHKLMVEAGKKLHLAEREIQPLGLDDTACEESSAALKSEEEPISGEAVTSAVNLCGPVEAKGILGSDGRLYVLDLVRITPKDCTVYEEIEHTDTAESKCFDAKEDGYVALLRPELIKLYTLWKQNQLRREKVAAEGKAKDNNDSKALENGKKANGTQSHASAQNGSAHAEQEKLNNDSEKPETLDTQVIEFNPNVFMKYGASTDAQQEKSDEKLARDAAEYLQKVVIPAFVTDLHRGSISPADGFSLTQLMHSCGINMRYLGRLVLHASKLDVTGNNIRYIIELLESEMIARATKHLTAYILNSNATIRAAPGTALVSLLNAIFGGCLRADDLKDEPFDLEGSLLNSNKTKNADKFQKLIAPACTSEKDLNGDKALETNCFAPESIWIRLADIIDKRFSYTLRMWGPNKCMEDSIRVHPHMLLRRICQRLGLHIFSRNYEFQSATPFCIDDISSVSPVVKHSLPDHPLLQAKQLLERGRFHLTTGSLASAYELLQEASALLFQVCGAAHEDAALCCSSLATVLYHAGDLAGAISQQQRALALYTQLKGIDYHDTAFAHANLALFLHANKESTAAVLHMRRSIYLLELCGGPYFPETSSLYFKLGMICQDIGSISLAFLCHRESLRRGGLDSLQAANTLHHMALACVSVGDYREALAYEKKVYGIYREFFGEKDTHTMEAAKYMARFTQKAVEGAKDRRQVDAAAAADAIAKQLLQEADLNTKVGEKKKSKKGKSVGNKSTH